MAFEVTANLYNGVDYYEHWDGGTFDNEDDAYNFWNDWWPPEDEVKAAAAECIENGDNPDEIELEIGVWDEDGNDVYFWNEGVRL